MQLNSVMDSIMRGGTGVSCSAKNFCTALYSILAVMDGNGDNLVCSLATTKGTHHFNMLGNLEGKNPQLFCS
jgi:hypothetical protein